MHVILTPEFYQVAAFPIENDFTPAGEHAIGFYVGDLLLAQRTIPSPDLDPLGQAILREPRQLLIFFREDTEGTVEGWLHVFAAPDQIPSEIRDELDFATDSEQEPWSASVPSYEAETPSAPGGFAYPLGVRKRRPEFRQYIGDLEAEAASMLASILTPGEKQSVAAHSADMLLRSITGL